MAQIKALGSSTYTNIADNEVAAALMNPANNVEQNDILLIDKVPYQFSTLIMGNSGGTVPPTLIGTMDYTEVNAAVGVSTTFSKTFAGAIPAGKILNRLYGKVVAFVSPTANLESSAPSSNLIVSTANVYNATQNLYLGNFSNTVFKYGPAGDITLNYVFAGGVNNPKDFTSGSVQVYAEFTDAPTV
jgi:hypothetical protein